MFVAVTGGGLLFNFRAEGSFASIIQNCAVTITNVTLSGNLAEGGYSLMTPGELREGTRGELCLC